MLDLESLLYNILLLLVHSNCVARCSHQVMPCMWWPLNSLISSLQLQRMPRQSLGLHHLDSVMTLM